MMLSIPSFTTKAKLFRADAIKINGVVSKQYSEVMDFYCSAKSYGGTERVINNKVVIEDTMNIITYYNPQFRGNSRIKLYDDTSEWDIITPPENVDRVNKICMFKVRRVVGGA